MSRIPIAVVRHALCLGAAGLVLAAGAARAQSPADADSRVAVIAAAQAKKATVLAPYVPNKAEALAEFVEDQFLTGLFTWHPYFESAYAGGGFTLGVGHVSHVGAYNAFDVRGSYTPSGYKRVEAEFRAPRLFNRRGVLSVIGGWREATQVGFYGTGTGNTSTDDRANYGFQQPYVSALLDVRPTRRLLVLGAGVEYAKWDTQAGDGTAPSIEEVYSEQDLPGLGASPTYLHTQGTVGIDWRPAAGYARRGGYYGVTAHNYSDADGSYDFSRMEYEVVQHLPVLRDAWVLSLRGRVETTHTSGDQQVPYFMLPALGGGSSLRGFTSWRFRDRNSLLMSAEWRVLVNRFIDTAVFYDAGKVTSTTSDLDFDGLKSNFGFGIRLHGPAATPLRIEFAKGNEGLAIVFSAKAAF